MTRHETSRTITHTLQRAAKAFFRRNMRCAVSHRFEIMPAHLLADMDMTKAHTLESCSAA